MFWTSSVTGNKFLSKYFWVWDCYSVQWDQSCSAKGKIKVRHVCEALCESGNHRNGNYWCHYYFRSSSPFLWAFPFIVKQVCNWRQSDEWLGHLLLPGGSWLETWEVKIGLSFFWLVCLHPSLVVSGLLAEMKQATYALSFSLSPQFIWSLGLALMRTEERYKSQLWERSPHGSQFSAFILLAIFHWISTAISTSFSSFKNSYLHFKIK